MKSAWLRATLGLVLSQLCILAPRRDGKPHSEAFITWGKPKRHDDNETQVLARQLEFIQSEVFSHLYPPPEALQHIPLDQTVPVGAASFTYREMEATGVAAIITDYAKDLPRVDFVVRETSQKIVDNGAAYGFTHRELQQAAYGQIQLDATKARLAREAIERHIDELLATGDTISGITGFTNNASVPTLAVANGGWTTGAVPEEILADLNESVTAVITQSRGVHKPNAMVLPQEEYEYIANTRRSSYSAETILEAFLKNPHIKEVSSWHLLDTAGPSSAPRGVCYHKDPSVVRGVVPSLFEQLPPEVRNMEMVVNCLGRIGGTVWYRPLAGVYMDGIA